MSAYHIAEVCPNGHVSTGMADAYPEHREEYCSKCGEKTSTHCPNCNAPIRGRDVDGFSIEEFVPPAFCHNCGNPFPWTQRKIDSAVELVESVNKLSTEEIVQFRSDLEELTKDSPKVHVASFRFKETMKKIGGSVATGVRDIVVDVLSEAAKKVILGK